MILNLSRGCSLLQKKNKKVRKVHPIFKREINCNYGSELFLCDASPHSEQREARGSRMLFQNDAATPAMDFMAGQRRFGVLAVLHRCPSSTRG